MTSRQFLRLSAFVFFMACILMGTTQSLRAGSETCIESFYVAIWTWGDPEEAQDQCDDAEAYCDAVCDLCYGTWGVWVWQCNDEPPGEMSVTCYCANP